MSEVAGSIKERIIQAAQSDPFLSVEEIARQVGTTQQYVRTILSESGLSLTKMRRAYVKKMERQLGLKEDEQVQLPQRGRLEVRQIEAPQLAELLGVDNDSPLFQASQFMRLGQAPGEVQGFAQLVTFLPLTILPEYTHLIELLPPEVKPPIQTRQWAVVVSPPEALRDAWGLDKNDVLFRLGTIWGSDDGPVAVEFHWVPAEGCALTWSEQKKGLSLEEIRPPVLG